MRMASCAALAIALWVAPTGAQTSVAGDWVLTLFDTFGPNVMRLSLSLSGETLTGSAAGRPIEGTFTRGTLAFKVRNFTVTGTLDGAALRSEAAFPDRTVKWTAMRIPPPPASPRTHDFEPSTFHLYFSSKKVPSLRIHPGDTVRTWSVDAGGVDRHGMRRSAGGNPQSGPFYVEGAMPNDTLVVRLNRVRLNRDWAQSGATVVANALEPRSLADVKWDPDFARRWKLDTARNVATLEKPTAALANLTIPLQPMLGCVGVAPQGELSIRTTDSGTFGGNMDYNQIREGTTLYQQATSGMMRWLQRDYKLTGSEAAMILGFALKYDVVDLVGTQVSIAAKVPKAALAPLKGN